MFSISQRLTWFKLTFSYIPKTSRSIGLWKIHWQWRQKRYQETVLNGGHDIVCLARRADGRLLIRRGGSRKRNCKQIANWAGLTKQRGWDSISGQYYLRAAAGPGMRGHLSSWYLWDWPRDSPRTNVLPIFVLFTFDFYFVFLLKTGLYISRNIRNPLRIQSTHLVLW